MHHSSQGCIRLDCPVKLKVKQETLDFTNWKRTPFKIIQEFECKESSGEFEWPVGSNFGDSPYP